MKKRVLIDATPLANYADGLSPYLINLVKHLPEESFNDIEYTILINPIVIPEDYIRLEQVGKIKIIKKRIARIGPKRDWDMFWFLRKHEGNFDLIHITSNNYPFALKKGICTIHDVTFKTGLFDSPKYTFNLAVTYMDWVIRNCLKKSKAIITVSTSTKDELIKWFKPGEIISNKIQVINQGWEHLQTYRTNDNASCDTPPQQHDYLFYLGTLRIHKNISNLLLAFKLAIKEISPLKKLAISGFNYHMRKEDIATIKAINEAEERVFFTGYLSNACVEEYFKNADAYILPSLSEGFGLPILEAFYFDTPVLCSNTTSLPEVAGNAAIYFNPYDPNDIAKAIVQFYNDSSLAAGMKQKGKEQLQKFSWKKTASKTVDLYKKVLDIS